LHEFALITDDIIGVRLQKTLTTEPKVGLPTPMNTDFEQEKTERTEIYANYANHANNTKETGPAERCGEDGKKMEAKR
jgi:hypothetical protein